MKPIFLFATLFFTNILFAQTTTEFTTFWNNYSQFNAGATGIEHKHYVSNTTRLQYFYSSLGGVPMRANLSVATNIENIKGAIGLNVDLDKYGITRTQKITPSYAYQRDFGDGKTLGAGLGIALIRVSNKYSQLNQNHPDDPVFLEQDKVEWFADVNCGLMYRSDHLLAGVGIVNIRQAFSNNKFSHFQYYLNAGYRIDIGEKVEVIPSVLFGNPLSNNFSDIDINLMTKLADFLLLGINYNHNQSISGTIGFEVMNKIRLAYTSESNSQIGRSSFLFNKHEIALSVRIDQNN